MLAFRKLLCYYPVRVQPRFIFLSHRRPRFILGRLTVFATLRWLVIALAAIMLLAACTRERPSPEPTATSAAETAEEQPDEPREPAVTSTTPEAAGSDQLTLTTFLTPTLTPVAADQETFQYVVQEGDTLGGIALRFGTDVEAIRALNNLDSDALYVGQPIYVPYVEGMTAEGMPTPTPGPFQYTIQPGDTLSAIGARFGVDAIQIIEANNLLDPNNLQVGSTILIPGFQPAEEQVAETEGATGEQTTGESVIHVVQANEGLFDIATQYGVTPDAIAEANNLANRNLLRVGQELIIPGVTRQEAAAAQGNVHVVAAGESLLGIAVRYGVTIEEILAANELDDPDAIFVGQELIIPTP
jgi:LysM repeat protein